MLFNSYEFIVFFLPISLLGYFLIGARGHHRIAQSWLVGVSLFFYGWWNPVYIGLIIGSVLFNYSLGLAITGREGGLDKKGLMVFGIVANMLLLGYFKYANFFVSNLNAIANTSYHLETIILPLAISFFTFQQITYLVDAYRGETREYNFLHYCLFVLFFPQLIAGPIVHHKEMLPQFAREAVYRLNSLNIAVGVTIFALGLFKKVVIADGIAVYATPVFSLADSGVEVTFFEAWIGALAYTFQLYFDFSGYSDMAIGLARMFGIILPVNFNSPYKATSIIDFWRRWHITLSRFLRDYLYIPLGGSRKGVARRYSNLMVTMLLGGMWHGAGWNFMLWGGMHGIYLVINHAWRNLVAPENKPASMRKVVGWLITFIAVVFAWVPFRAESVEGVKILWASMLGMNGVQIPDQILSVSRSLKELFVAYGGTVGEVFPNVKYPMLDPFAWLTMLILIAVIMPNTQQFLRKYRPILKTYGDEMMAAKYIAIEWQPTLYWAVFISVLTFVVIVYGNRVSEFLYFQF